MDSLFVDLEAVARSVIAFMQMNQRWAPIIVFLIAFCECVAILSWLVPATVFFTALGAVAGASGLDLFPLALSAGCGAGLGFWVSYWFGLKFGPRAADYWPFRDNPQMLEKGHVFFEKWGMLGIFIGHFFGPMRAVVALVAGIVRMPAWQFNIANLVASFAWGFGLLYGAGLAGGEVMRLRGFWGF